MPARGGEKPSAGLSRAIDIHEAWRVATDERREKYTKKWKKMQGTDFIDRKMWDDLSDFIVTDLVIADGERNEGESYKVGTALGYISLLMNDAARRCEELCDPRLLEGGSKQAEGMQTEVHRQ